MWRKDPARIGMDKPEDMSTPNAQAFSRVLSAMPKARNICALTPVPTAQNQSEACASGENGKGVSFPCCTCVKPSALKSRFLIAEVHLVVCSKVKFSDLPCVHAPPGSLQELCGSSIEALAWTWLSKSENPQSCVCFPCPFKAAPKGQPGNPRCPSSRLCSCVSEPKSRLTVTL